MKSTYEAILEGLASIADISGAGASVCVEFTRIPPSRDREMLRGDMRRVMRDFSRGIAKETQGLGPRQDREG